MKDYSRNKSTIPSIQERAIEKVFDTHYRNSLEGILTSVDGNDVRAIIQKHTNPINSYLEDKLWTSLLKESKSLKWGSYIEAFNERKYIALTKPETTDGVTLKTKVRKVTNKAVFYVDGTEYIYDCIATNYPLYDGTTYQTDVVVYTDDDREAIVLPWDDNTDRIKYIDSIFIDGDEHRVIMIDKITDEVNGVKQGIIQFVCIKNIFGEVFVNGKPVRAILNYARMKDKKLNARSKEIISDFNTVKSGDYVEHVYMHGDIEERRMYIAETTANVYLNYDIIYAFKCETFFNMWDYVNNCVYKVPCYIDDNSTRLEDVEKVNVAYLRGEYKIMIQYNDITKDLGTKYSRIIIKGKPFEITGFDHFSLDGVMYLGLTDSFIDPNKDNLEYAITDFYDSTGNTEADISKATNSLEIIGNDNCTITCEEEYIVDTDLEVIWTVEDTNNAVKFVSDCNKCKITASSSAKKIGSTVTIKATIGDVTLEKQVSIIGWR